MRIVPSLAARRLAVFLAVAGILSLTAVPAAQSFVRRQDAFNSTLNYAKRTCADNLSCRKYAANACIRKDGGIRCLAWNYDRNKRKGKYACKRVLLWESRVSPEFLTDWKCYPGWSLGPSFRIQLIH
jgi:hypothetical protein